MLRRHFDHKTHLATGQLRGGNLGHEVVGLARHGRIDGIGRAIALRRIAPRTRNRIHLVGHTGLERTMFVAYPGRHGHLFALRRIFRRVVHLRNHGRRTSLALIVSTRRQHRNRSGQHRPYNQLLHRSFSVFICRDAHPAAGRGNATPAAAIRCRTARSYRKRDPSNRR